MRRGDLKTRARAAYFPLLLVAIIASADVSTMQAFPQRIQAGAAVVPEAPLPVMVKHPRHQALDFQAGASVLLYGNDSSFQRKSEAALDRLAGLGVNSLSVVVPFFTDSWTATRVYSDPIRTPSTARIGGFIQAAHRRGFTILLRPLLDEQSLNLSGRWRGIIVPTSQSAWFASYTSLIVGFAQLAQREGVEILDVGSEFSSLQRDTKAWLQVIAAIKRVYAGALTYSSNFDRAYPAFGRALDFVSVDAYYPLNAPVNATAAELVVKWQPWVARATEIAHTFGKPLVFTELGTTSEVGSFRQPWIWKHQTGVSLEAQRVYYAATCQALKSRLDGMYWWAFDLDPLTLPAIDPGYSPQGKSAEGEVARCFA